MNFLRIRMFNSSSLSSRNQDIQHLADIWIARRRTGMFEAPIGIQSAFFINAIKGRYVLCRNLCVCCEIIIKAISSDLFQQFPDADKLFVVVPLKPIVKQFPTISNCHTRSNGSTQPYPDTLRYPELLQRKIWLTGLVVWVHLINRTKKLRHEKDTSNRANWDIRKLVRILQ